jgi:hypothetical protein
MKWRKIAGGKRRWHQPVYVALPIEEFDALLETMELVRARQ